MKNRLPKYPHRYSELPSDADQQQLVTHLKHHSRDQQSPRQDGRQRRLVHFQIDGALLIREAFHQKHLKQCDRQKLQDQPLTQLLVPFFPAFKDLQPYLLLKQYYQKFRCRHLAQIDSSATHTLFESPPSLGQNSAYSLANYISSYTPKYRPPSN